MKAFYFGLIRFGEFVQPLLLLAIRLAVGCAFLQTGWGKLSHIEQTAGFFENLHLPLPTFQAYLVGTAEFLGGGLLILGLGSRLAASVLAIVMVVALLTAHYESVQAIWINPGLIAQEAAFLFLLSVLMILAFGPGIISLDALIKRFTNRGIR